MKEKIGQYIGTTKNDQSRFFRGVKIGMVGLALTSFGLDRVNETFSDTRPDKPISIERVVDVDTENLEELDLARGTIVYNDTEDTYLVYLDDTEANPAQEAGWYEIDLNEAPKVPEGE